MKFKIDKSKKLSHINPEIYGHFSEHLGRCIYNGIYVGENSLIPNTNGMRNDVVEALKEIKIPVLRWPGGCFADEYHWKDGIGEKSKRKKMINTHWGGVVEDNSFGTHEFFELCEQLGCEPYVAGNLGSGTVQELAEWVEYMTFDGVSPMADLRKKNGREKPWKLKYLGIGNENWGCGGNMRPEYYADEYRRYQTYCRNFSGNELYKVACGPNADDYNWTDTLLSIVKNWHTRAISLHYYTVPTGDWSHKGSATSFDDNEYYNTIKSTLFMEEIIKNHVKIMDKHDPENKIGLIVDEWGCWYDVEEGTNPGFLYQQNSMRDAIVSAINLNIFNNHSDRVVMANLAQVVNVLQSVILTDGENMVKTPTYYVFKMFLPHQNSDLVEVECNEEKYVSEKHIPKISKSASVDSEGKVCVTISNCSLDESEKIEIDVGNVKSVCAKIINANNVTDFNDFGEDEKVTLKDYVAEIVDGKIFVEIPPCSVVSLEII